MLPICMDAIGRSLSEIMSASLALVVRRYEVMVKRGRQAQFCPFASVTGADHREAFSSALPFFILSKPTESMSSDEDTPMSHILEDALAPIAKPLASGKLLKRMHKLVSKATKEKQIKRGVKEAVKAIRKGAKGYVNIIQALCS
jgi:hypothetical protein